MAAARRPRTWTMATGLKLDVLEAYLSRFTLATQRSPTRVYIDLFAGGVANIDRDTGRELISSAHLALRAEPPFDVLRYVELPSKAAALEAKLRAEYPTRNIRVYPGDCNEVLPDLLKGLANFRDSPTFAFVDPDGMEVAWPTLELLARHKRPGRSKVEMWILFAAPGIIRSLSLDPTKVTEADFERADRLFGNSRWQDIYQERKAGRLSAARAREQYVDLMRWQLQHELGYRWTHVMGLRNSHGTPLYTMVFATDHKAGSDIMTHLYRAAYEEYHVMRAAVARKREREAGLLSLFDDSGVEWQDAPFIPEDARYRHEPPQPPIGWDPD